MLLTSTVAWAQTAGVGNPASLPKPTPYQIAERDANSRTWERYTFDKTPDGTVVARRHRVVELATGMNYWNNGQWTASKEQISILPQGGAAATQGQHQAYLPGDIYNGVIQLVTPDGKHLQSRPIGISFDDGQNTVLIAQLTNSIGVLVSPNQVVYPNAFTGINADLVYTYREGGFEQDVILREQPPSPVSLGLDATAKLQLLTEFTGSPEPAQQAAMADQRDNLQDTTLNFGVMQMVQGWAFSINASGGRRTKETPTYKSWLHLQGRTFLIEQVPYERIAPQLEQLPTTSRLDTSETNLLAANSILNKASARRLLPPAREALADTQKIQLARLNLAGQPGVVLDYMTVNTATNFTFQGDTTYYVSNSVNLAGLTTIEGGTVIKYDTNYTCAVNILGAVQCATSPYRPAILTSASDTTVGEPVSVGNPLSCNGTLYFYVENDYYENLNYELQRHTYGGTEVLYGSVGGSGGVVGPFDVSASPGEEFYLVASDGYGWQNYYGFYTTLSEGIATIDIYGVISYFQWGDSICTPPAVSSLGLSLANGGSLNNINFRNLNTGVQSDGACSATNLQFVRCGAAFDMEYTNLYAGNILMSYVGIGFGGRSFKTTAEHLTFDQGVDLGEDYSSGSSSISLTNSLLTHVTYVPGGATVTWHTNAVVKLSSSSGVYKATGAGGYYLATNSPYHSLGTTTITPALKAQLGQKTTWPPIVYTGGTISVITNYSPWVPRDTNAAPDLGYHYDPLDYVFGGVEAKSNVTFTAGTAVGWYDTASGNTYGIKVDTNAVVFFNGTVTSPCWLARYDTVQEAGNGAWTGIGLSPITSNNTNAYYTAGSPQLLMQFTKFSTRKNGDELRDYTGNFVVCAQNCEFYGPVGGADIQLGLTNCLLYQFAPSVSSSGAASPQLVMQNCTVEMGTLSIQHQNGSIWPVSIYDCAFDGTTINVDTNGLNCDYNTFLTNTNLTPILGGHEVTNVISYNWQTSWFGNYYQPTNSLLIDTGDRTAGQLGLAFFTTQTNQMMESNTVVDIGYHYVAVNTNGLPFTDINGVPYYLQSGLVPDGSGLPIWWQLQYFGTNGVDPYGDPVGDGWNNLQKFQNGMNPNVFYTPPAPQGVTVNYNSFNATAKISWLPSPGPVTGYTVEKTDTFVGGGTQDFSVSAGATRYQDDVSGDSSDPFAGGALDVSYKVLAHYAGGDSSWSSSMPLEQNSLSANVIGGPQGMAYLTTSPLPSGTMDLRLTLIDEVAWLNYYLNGGDEPVNPTYDIPVADPMQNQYAMPALDAIASPEVWASSYSYVQSINTNGNISAPTGFSVYSASQAGPPYIDGRAQLKQNLIFLLRSATEDAPFNYIEVNTNTGDSYSFANPPQYVYAGFYPLDEDPNDSPFLEENIGSFDATWPFESNWRYRNFVLDATNLDAYGSITTGAGGNYLGNSVWLSSGGYRDYPGGLLLETPAVFQFPGATNGAVIPALLATNDTRWLASYALDSSYYYLGLIGITNDTGAGTFTMYSNARNYWGLPLLSANISGSSVLYAGNSTGTGGYFYPETAQPQFQLAEYDFWQRSPVPGSAGFAITNASDVLIAPVGVPVTVNGYAKLAVLNSYSGVYGYLGQYFTTNAYQIDSSGIITTNATGILSPYGNFFATEPSPAALVTMPDIDTGEQGTCTVYCVSLVLDKNHDLKMDTSFSGQDATSASSPDIIWCDNGFDRFVEDKDDQAWYDDSVSANTAAACCPYTPNTPTPNYNYRDGAGNRVIPCERDLQNFFRLWVAGIDTNLIAKLPAGSTITLNWGDVGSPNTGNPTIDIFTAADPDGGIGYLTNSDTAFTQTDPLSCPYIGRLAPGGSIQLNAATFANHWAGNYFIMCGVTNGSGSLSMTIADGSGNVLAQSTSYLQIVDIKQMYERWTIGDQPSRAPLTNAVLASDGLPPFTSAFQYTPPQDTNTPYILYVHGWNMNYDDKNQFAESAFKRLYWQGYQGRFGCFRWPTDYDFNATLMDALFQPHNYDGSEYNAWLSAVGLLNKLNDLNAEYPGHVYMLAHSMGNVVAGEALRLAAQSGSGQIVNTYVASQGAIPAHVYDATVTSPYLIDYTHKNPSYPFSAPGAPKTPNIYGNRLTNNIAVVGHRINFYNVNDYALSPDAWCFDQELKPDTFIGSGYYFYAGSTNDAAPWNNFEYALYVGSPLTLDIVNNLNDRYEVLAYAANPYSTALGATPVATLSGSIDMTDPNNHIWPADTSGHNYSDHFWHSAEFRGDYWQMQGYWNTLLFSSQSGFNISNP